ncbi:DUF4214 domain-containing protein [Iamia majanohamensis]|uniref:DUF4214 domain-containing protein n=1 Tax=Iamia majanohamensis TaxID=467976 RepID=A0AAE9Y699_9ACTN|nr:DUF4214 domain-containing protein [Iamia majanohamensis]WCO66346.1 DUF4214 domain-containing protein [Iamia majanohamensis]
MRTLRRVAAALVGVAVAGVLLAVPTSPAGAAGVTTHAWMGLTAIERVSAPELAALLDAHRDQVRAGAMFPDGGYIPGNVHGEEAHWSRFTDAYAARLMARTDCGDLTRPDGPCAAEVAHLMGVIAHGAGDEVWDWLFEPVSPDLDEYYLPEALSAVQDGGGQELTMDIVAIGLHDRPVGPLPALPSKPDIMGAFADVGRTDITEAMVDTGQAGLGIISEAEAGFVAEHLAGVRREMPWMTTNLVSAPGGVSYAADAIAGQWDSMWGRLLGDQPPTRVSVTYPADGQRRIPAAGWVRSYQPGSAPGRGGARTRIAASLTWSLPYVPRSGPSVSAQLPPGAMTLTPVDGTDPLPLLSGYPRAVPYGPDAGEHTIDLQPAADLQPCAWYRVDVTDALLDADGEPVVPTSWTFRTGLDAAGSRCPDDPYTPVENHVRALYQDLLGRTPSDPEVGGWTAQVERGLSRPALVAALVGSGEARRRLVDAAYASDLDRTPDPDGRAFWTEYLRTHPVTMLRTRLLASPEVYAQGGGTDEGYVAHLYDVVLQRPVDTTGSDFWTAQLAGGLSRAAVARRLLVSAEVTRRAVRTTYEDLVDRTPGTAEVDFWAPRVASTDTRTLVRALLRTDAYVAQAQVP